MSVAATDPYKESDAKTFLALWKAEGLVTKSSANGYIATEELINHYLNTDDRNDFLKKQQALNQLSSKYRTCCNPYQALYLLDSLYSVFKKEYIAKHRSVLSDNAFMAFLTAVSAEVPRKTYTRPEKPVQLRLANSIGGRMEVPCELGVIDIVDDTRKEIIEVKELGTWKCAIRQINGYHQSFPTYTKRIHLFTTKDEATVAHKMDEIRATCARQNIVLTIEYIAKEKLEEHQNDAGTSSVNSFEGVAIMQTLFAPPILQSSTTPNSVSYQNTPELTVAKAESYEMMINAYDKEIRKLQLQHDMRKTEMEHEMRKTEMEHEFRMKQLEVELKKMDHGGRQS